MKKTAFAIAFAIAISAPVVQQVNAGSVAGFGGSLEITQLVNVAQLAASYVQQVEAVVQQVRQYQAMMQDLQNLDPSRAEQILRNEYGLNSLSEAENAIRVAGQLSTTLGELQQDMTVVAYEKQLAADVVQRLRAQGHDIGPNDYAYGMRVLAEERSGVYAERYQDFNRAIENSRRNIAVSQELARQAPRIEGTVEGLAALNIASAQMNAELANVSSLMAQTAQMQLETRVVDDQRAVREAQVQAAEEAAGRQLLRRW